MAFVSVARLCLPFHFLSISYSSMLMASSDSARQNGDSLITPLMGTTQEMAEGNSTRELHIDTAHHENCMNIRESEFHATYVSNAKASSRMGFCTMLGLGGGGILCCALIWGALQSHSYIAVWILFSAVNIVH